MGVEEYLKTKHYNLGQLGTENSAFLVSMMLLTDGKDPTIMRVQETIRVLGYYSYQRVFYPVSLPDAPLTSYDVCVADGMVFDPLVGEPVSLDDYTRVAFGDDIPMSIQLSSTDVRRRKDSLQH